MLRFLPLRTTNLCGKSFVGFSNAITIRSAREIPEKRAEFGPPAASLDEVILRSAHTLTKRWTDFLRAVPMRKRPDVSCWV